jgi:RNA polymerase-binding protein DksA
MTRKADNGVGLTEEQVGRLKGALVQKRDQIIQQQRSQLSELYAPDKHHLADLEEMASDTMETDSLCALFNLGSATLSEIEAALEKIEQGTYGACESCEKPIHPDRLEVLPFASLCVSCQRQKEKDRLVREGER